MIRLLRKIIALYFQELFKKHINKTPETILICDIDNSIANTWPQWKNPKTKAKTFYKNIPPLVKSINFVKEFCSNNNLNLIFISARPYSEFSNTKTWIKFYFGESNLVFLVKNASDKMWYYKKLIDDRKDFIVFDDLSYNHENGDVKYYTEIADFLKKNNIKHFDYKFITCINEETP
jgi:hypothetical protein